NYVGSLNLWPFFDNTTLNLPGLLTLTYVPNYFDILPMYIVILALIPVIMIASRISVWAAFAVSIGLWLAANFQLLNLPAEPWSDRSWYFNPFAWQLVFFTGFAFMRGWIPSPPVDQRLIALAVAVLLLSLPFAYFRIHPNVEFAQTVRDMLKPLWIKSEFGFLRYVHFLALAYLAWVAAGDKGFRLFGHGRIWGGFVRIVQKVGQQSLAVFMASLVIAQAAGILRDMVWGRGEWLPQTLSNLLGFAALIAVAYVVAWFKGQPWRKSPKPQTSQPPEEATSPRSKVVETAS
ncbi:OpgC domain-containing protein, partial [Marinobacter sp.]|uniref:OpgC family protein n=1 Tax=Marinobacter sp. TaxID=50741 RepID=UPI00329A3CAD